MLAVPGADEIGIDLYIVGQVLAPFATAVGNVCSSNSFEIFSSVCWNCYFDEKVLKILCLTMKVITGGLL